MKNTFGREEKDWYLSYEGTFLDESVRLVLIDRKTYIVVRDMFKVLGRLKSNGSIHSDDIGNLLELLDNLNERDKYLENIKVYTRKVEGRDSTSELNGNKRNGEMQNVNLLNIEVLPTVLTQYRPTKKSKNYDNKLEIWSKFMRWVNKLLQEYHLEDVIINDKRDQIKLHDKCEELGLDSSVVNKHININMAKLVGVYNQGIKELTKDDLRYYNDNKSIDLLFIRQEIIKEYLELYESCNSKKIARVVSLNKMINKYKLKIDKDELK